MTPFKLALLAAIFFAMPVILYQIWAFVAPGLYRHERRFALPLFVSSVILFYGGATFAYFVVFPLAFKFFVGTTPEGVRMMTDMTQYMDFAVLMFFAFGLAFEIPVATVLLVRTGLVKREALTQESRLRDPRHLHHRRLPDAARSHLADSDGDPDVRCSTKRASLCPVSSYAPSRPTPRPIRLDVAPQHGGDSPDSRSIRRHDTPTCVSRRGISSAIRRACSCSSSPRCGSASVTTACARCSCCTPSRRRTLRIPDSGWARAAGAQALRLVHGLRVLDADVRRLARRQLSSASARR